MYLFQTQYIHCFIFFFIVFPGSALSTNQSLPPCLPIMSFFSHCSAAVEAVKCRWIWNHCISRSVFFANVFYFTETIAVQIIPYLVFIMLLKTTGFTVFTINMLLCCRIEEQSKEQNNFNWGQCEQMIPSDTNVFSTTEKYVYSMLFLCISYVWLTSCLSLDSRSSGFCICLHNHQVNWGCFYTAYMSTILQYIHTNVVSIRHTEACTRVWTGVRWCGGNLSLSIKWESLNKSNPYPSVSLFEAKRKTKTKKNNLHCPMLFKCSVFAS